jgi:hypothetical protein
LGRSPADLEGEPATWNLAFAEDSIRTAIALAAKTPGPKKKGWFKRVDLAERLGKIVVDHWAAIKGTDLRSKIEAVRTWTRADG